MAYALGVLVIVVGLIVSIALHELGHLLPAKAFGVKVPRYFVGFGPTVWSTRRGETEYGVKALPLGGFVSIAGMFPPLRPGRTERPRRDGRPTLVQDAREASAQELGPGQEHRAFYSLSVPKKMAVMFGGPVVNLLLCVLLLGVVVSGFGLVARTSTVAGVVECLPAADGTSPRAGDLTCTPTPGAASGLREGDQIIAWGERTTADWADVQSAIREGGTGTVQVEIVRGGATMAVDVTPALVDRPTLDDEGAVVLDAAGDPVLAPTPYVGIGPDLALEPQPLTVVPGMVWEQAKATFGVILRLPIHLANAASSIVTGAERTDGVMSVVGVGRVAGEIASVDTPGEYGTTERFADLLSILASLNMALFAFNMIPLLPLDGGHLAGALFEGVRRAWARLRGRPDPGPTDTARLLPATYVVAGLLGVMALILIVADIVNPLSLFG